MPPAISVVIPLYNKRDYIERCLQSVRRQTFTDYQIVVVNDGSTDGSDKLVEPFLQKGDDLIQKERGNYPAVRNWGFAAAEGDLIASLDADDEWLPEHLADIYELAERFPEAGLFATGTRTYRPPFVLDRYVAGGKPRLANYFRISAIAGVCNCSSAAFRREIFDELGGFLIDEPVGADLECWARISLHWPMALHPRVSSVIYVAASTASTRSAEVKRIGPELAYDMLEKALENGLVPSELETDVKTYIAATRLQRTKYLIRKGFIRLAADMLNQDTRSGAMAGSASSLLKTYTRLARWLRDGSRPAVLSGRVVVSSMVDPVDLLFAGLGMPRRKGDVIFRGGFACYVR